MLTKIKAMTKYNFDEVVDRHNTNALKTDVLKERYGRDDLIPMWVADMDFLSPPAITDAIVKRAKHGIFGYTCASDSYYTSIINWIEKYHQWNIKKEWITFIPGVVKGIAFAIDCFSKTSDSVIIQPPVYHPFKIVTKAYKRTLVYNPLKLEAGKYKMDTQDLRNKIDTSCSILILCNPHNPGGRVWTKEELLALADICYDNNILVISDEIHSDLVRKDCKHIPFASVSEKAAQNSITLMAPSKSFNIAGIVSSFSIIPNDDIRDKFNTYLKRSELDEGHIFAYLATQVAYEEGSEWLSEVKDYILKNVNFVNDFIEKNIPQIKVMKPEASFLVWLDCKGLNMSQQELVSLFVNDAKLALNDGQMFGEEGIGYMRMNIGCPLSIIEKALNNLKEAVDNLV